MITSLIRTVAPMLAGWLLSLPVVGPVADALGLSDAQVSAGVVVALGAMYYAAARALEHRWPRLGVLLGRPVAPRYERPDPTPSKPAPLTPST